MLHVLKDYICIPLLRIYGYIPKDENTIFLVRRMKLIYLFVLILDINECKDSNKCFGNCTNLPGKFLCLCPKGTSADPYTRNGCVAPHDLDTGNNYLTHTSNHMD